MRFALLLAAVLALSVSAQEPLSVAVLREDGYLVPMVTIRGDDYAPLTVFDGINNKSSFTRQAARLTGEWRWWRVGGSEAPPLTTLKRAFVDNHCSTEEAWQTTVRGKQVEPYVADIKKIGIAVRNGEVVPPEDLTDRPDQASRKFVPLIVSLAHSREAERLRTDTTNPIHEFDPATRASRAVVIEKLIRHQDAGLGHLLLRSGQEIRTHPRLHDRLARRKRRRRPAARCEVSNGRRWLQGERARLRSRHHSLRGQAAVGAACAPLRKREPRDSRMAVRPPGW